MAGGRWEGRSYPLFGEWLNKKGKFHPTTGHEIQEGEEKISSTLSLTSALEKVGGQRHAPTALFPGKRPSTHCTGGWVGPRTGLDTLRKISPPLGFDPRTVQTVVSHYTDWDILAHGRDWIQPLNSSVILAGSRLGFEPCTPPHLGRMPHPSTAPFFTSTVVIV
jgi:hypothetical protein